MQSSSIIICMKVTILGAGEFGKILGNIAEGNGNEVKYYDPYKLPKVKLEEALEGAEAMIYAAPSSAADEILPKLPKEVPLICASKGFVSMRPFAEFTAFSALAGAGMAEDIVNNEPPYGDKFLFTASSELAEFLFTTDDTQIEYTPDTLVILLCGALKNMYAIACGMKILDYSVIMREWTETLELNGATDLIMYSCGFPDLVMSVAKESRNTKFGRMLVNVPEGAKVEPAGTVEGVTAINSLDKYPEFKIPESAEILRGVIAEVKDATKL